MQAHLPNGIQSATAIEPAYFPGYRDVWDNIVVARTAAHPWGAQLRLAYLLLSGVFDRHPNFRVGFSETGCGWLPQSDFPHAQCRFPDSPGVALQWGVPEGVQREKLFSGNAAQFLRMAA